MLKNDNFQSFLFIFWGLESIWGNIEKLSSFQQLFYSRLQIKPPQIANCDKFPETCGEDLRVICDKYFSFNEYSFIY